MESISPVNPHDLGRGPMIVGVTWAFTILAMMAVGLRIYVRLKLSKFLVAEDWLMLVAVVLQVVNEALVSVSYHYGMGKHDADLEQPTQFVNVLKWNWFASAPGMMVSIIARISITLLLIRLFGVHKLFKWFTISLTALQTIVCGLIIPFTWCQVKPVEGLWNVYMTNVDKWDPRVVLYLEYAGQSLYTLSDITYVLFPVIIIWKLHMPTRRKIGLAAMLAGSFVTAAISVVKTISAQGSSKYTVDVQYNASLGVLWSSLEESLVIIMGSIPTLRAITNLEFPYFSALGSSLSSLIRKGRGKEFSSEDGYGTSGLYHDLEMNHQNLGQNGATGAVITPENKSGHESTQNLFPTASSRVVCTEEFIVSYE